MYFDSFSAILSMEGHGGFVWAAYAITVTVLLLLVMAPRRRQARFLKQLSGELRRQQGAAPTREET